MTRSSLLAKNKDFEIHAIRFPVLEGMTLEGLWLHPSSGKAKGNMIVVPDADQTPEALAGLTNDLPST